MSETDILDWRMEAATIPAAGRTGTRAATEAERTALAAALDLQACDRLEAAWRVMPLAGDRIRLHGTLTADVVQTCVVTLEPVPAHLETRFDVTFWQPDQLPEPDPSAPLDDAAVLEAGDDEPIVDGDIELGRIVYETLAIALDPYPRRAGAELAPEVANPPDLSGGPFAALARLKGKP